MKERGIGVSFASDNTRDPFYAYGDLDMLEVMREATRIGHLDHSDSDWTHAFTTNPARAAGFAAPFPGRPAPPPISCSARQGAGRSSSPARSRTGSCSEPAAPSTGPSLTTPSSTTSWTVA